MNIKNFNLILFSMVYVLWALTAIVLFLYVLYIGEFSGLDVYVNSIVHLTFSFVVIFSLIRLFKNDFLPAIVIVFLLGFNIDFEQLKFVNILLFHGEIAYHNNGDVEFLFLLFGGPDITINTNMEIISFNKIGYNFVSMLQIFTLLLQEKNLVKS